VCITRIHYTLLFIYYYAQESKSTIYVYYTLLFIKIKFSYVRKRKEIIKIFRIHEINVYLRLKPRFLTMQSTVNIMYCIGTE